MFFFDGSETSQCVTENNAVESVFYVNELNFDEF